jgi:hypothetical protein
VDEVQRHAVRSWASRFIEMALLDLENSNKGFRNTNKVMICLNFRFLFLADYAMFAA